MCRELELPSSTLCSSDNSVWFLLIWFKLAQKKKKKKAPATHPLIGNGRSSLNIGVSAIAGVKLGSHRRTVFREEREKKDEFTTLPLNFMPMNPFQVFLFSFFFFYLKPCCSPVLVGLWYRVSLTLRSAGVKGVNLREIRFVYHGPENVMTAARHACVVARRGHQNVSALILMSWHGKACLLFFVLNVI